MNGWAAKINKLTDGVGRWHFKQRKSQDNHKTSKALKMYKLYSHDYRIDGTCLLEENISIKILATPDTIKKVRAADETASWRCFLRTWTPIQRRHALFSGRIWVHHLTDDQKLDRVIRSEEMISFAENNANFTKLLFCN